MLHTQSSSRGGSMNYRTIILLLLAITLVYGQTAISADKVLTDSSPTNVAPEPADTSSSSSNDGSSKSDDKDDVNVTGNVTDDTVNTDQAKSPEIQVISIETTERVIEPRTTREEIYEQISLPSKFELDQTTVDALSQIKLEDNSRFVKITKATTKLVQINSEKERFMQEMLKIEPKFFDRIYLSTEKIHPRIEMQKQVYNYLRFTETGDSEVVIDDSRIAQVFDQGSTQELYDSLIRLP